MDLQRPAASFRFPAPHQFTYDIASVTICELRIRKANACIVGEHVIVRPQFEAIDRHFSPHTFTKSIHAGAVKLATGPHSIDFTYVTCVARLISIAQASVRPTP